MLNFRLFAGLTSFISNLALSQACSIGPEGTLESRTIFSLKVNDPGHHGDRNRYVPEKQKDRNYGCSAFDTGHVFRVRAAQRLESAVNSVVQVQAQKCDRHDISDRDRNLLKPVNQVREHLALLEVRVNHAR